MEDITTAKKALEKIIISNAFVTSIGTRTRGDESFIEVGVEAEKDTVEIKKHLTDGKWQGHSVEIIVKPMSEPHQ
jgi:hypothetical protein